MLKINLYGDGPELSFLSGQFNSNAFHFYGRLDDLDDIYNNLDIVVIPSLKPEAFSIVIPEAWSYGCFVLASDVPAHKELIQDGVNGRLFLTGDSKDLYNKLECYLQDWKGHVNHIAGGYNSLASLQFANFAPQLSQLILK
jgi:phosphatidylinositol alpha-mannosyltransferase